MSHLKRSLSIVIPVCNEEGNLSELWSRVNKISDELSHINCEFIFVDNGSTDSSGSLCRQFVSSDKRAKYIRFSRNFGIEASFSAGAKFASGDALIYLFSDLQDPPEMIPHIVKKWEEGYDVVYGSLSKREDNKILKSWGAFLAYRLIFLMSDIKIPLNATDYRLLSRKVIDVLNNCPERNRYMRGLTHWVGFRQAPFEFERSPRKNGESKAGLSFCISYALNAVFAFSTKPLRLATYIGLFATLLSVVGAFSYIAHAFLTRSGIINITPPPAGWATTTLLIFFFGGIQCLFLGIIGEYVARIHDESKYRPLWVVDEKEGFDV
jgi:glycosyltransferase involved in cell wall biosynthesis